MQTINIAAAVYQPDDEKSFPLSRYETCKNNGGKLATNAPQK